MSDKHFGDTTLGEGLSLAAVVFALLFGFALILHFAH